MPTGYTADVASGKVTDLKTFALTLARGMGALVTMRDEPWDAPIPDKFEPSSYHVDRLVVLRDEYRVVLGMTLDDCEAKIDEELQEFRDNRSDRKNTHDETKQNYSDMLDKVQAWTGAPEGLKEFAISQLEESMKFDCREPFKYYGNPPEQDSFKWKQNKLESLKKDIMHHSEKYSEEVDRVDRRNKWVKQLKESLND